MPSVFIPSASGWPSALLSHQPVVLTTLSRRQSSNKGWRPSRYRHPYIVGLSILTNLFYPFQLPPTPYLRHFLYWRVMEYMFLLIALFLKRRENYVQGFPRAAAYLILWTGGMFLLALLLTRASLRLPRPSIPYISSTSSSFFSISFLLIFERERPSPLFSSTQPLLPSTYPSLSLKQFFSRRSSYP